MWPVQPTAIRRRLLLGVPPSRVDALQPTIATSADSYSNSQGQVAGKKSCQKNAPSTSQPSTAHGTTGEAKVKYIVQTKQAIRRPYAYSTVHPEHFMGPRFLKVSPGGMSESRLVQATSQCAQSVAHHVPDLTGLHGGLRRKAQYKTTLGRAYGGSMFWSFSWNFCTAH